MEQQTVSVAKSGIICTLNARTSILAAANPIKSKYDPMMSVVENIDLPPSLMSRFDLIYLVLDKPDATSDRRLAKHIVALYEENVVRPPALGIYGIQQVAGVAVQHQQRRHNEVAAPRREVEGRVPLFRVRERGTDVGRHR